MEWARCGGLRPAVLKKQRVETSDAFQQRNRGQPSTGHTVADGRGRKLQKIGDLRRLKERSLKIFKHFGVLNPVYWETFDSTENIHPAISRRPMERGALQPMMLDDARDCTSVDLPVTGELGRCCVAELHPSGVEVRRGGRVG